VRQNGARAARRQRRAGPPCARRGELFTGSITWSRQVEIVYADDSLAKKYVEGRCRPALKDKVKEMRHHLLESICRAGDAILHKLSREQAVRG